MPISPVQPSSIMGYRDGVIAAIRNQIPTGVRVERHDGYFDLETIERISTVAPAIFVAVMNARPVRDASNVFGHAGGTGEQSFTLDTVCFVVTTQIGGFEASDLAWAIGEQIASLAVMNAFTDAVLPALDVSIENLWSNKSDKRGLSLLSVAWKNELQLGSDWSALSTQILGALPGDTFGMDVPEGGSLSITVTETLGENAQALPTTSPLSFAVAAARVATQPAPFKGFGYVQYVPLASAAGVLFEAGQRVPLSMAVSGAALDTLSGPFANWSFWDGADFNARAVGDAYNIRLTLIARSAVAGGSIYLDAEVNGASAPIETARDFLGNVAGVDQIMSFHITLYPKQTFVDGGARIFITPDVPVLITNSKLIIEPTNAG